jgi:hypothetical protein
MNNLYSFGCSFSSVNFKNYYINTFNYVNHKLYNELLAEKLNLNLINEAYEGIGNNSIILNFAETEFKDNSLVIIQLTFPNRIEFRKENNTNDFTTTIGTITQPISSATLTHFSNEVITEKHKETYLDFVNTWDDILTFNDIYQIVNSIKKKEAKYPNCKFLLITPHYVKKQLFEKNINLHNYIKLNQFLNLNVETWTQYGIKINDKKYLGDGHLSPNGNETLYKNILNIL